MYSSLRWVGMTRLALATVVCGLLAGGLGASADEDATEKKLKDAKGEYEEAVVRARAKLVGDLKSKADGAQKAGDLKALERAELEITAFEQKSELPKLVPTKGYESELRKAKARMEDAYAAAVSQFTKDGKIALAKATQQELDDFKRAGIPGEQKWVPLFNGKDLTGWEPSPDSDGNWAVSKDGTLTGTGPEISHLYTKRSDYRDFHLKAQVKTNAGGNSGIYVRANNDMGTKPNGAPFGYEAQIYPLGAADDAKTGSLLGGTKGVKVTQVLTRPNTWVNMEVIVKGTRITIKVNNKVTADATGLDNLPAAGRIALQVWRSTPATKVEFRNIEILETGK